jgi:hypothetical protein
MDMDDVERYRRQAAVCREEADNVFSSIEASNWLRLAREFEELARRVQLRSQRKRPPSLWIDSHPTAL